MVRERYLSESLSHFATVPSAGVQSEPLVSVWGFGKGEASVEAIMELSRSRDACILSVVVWIGRLNVYRVVMVLYASLLSSDGSGALSKYSSQERTPGK